MEREQSPESRTDESQDQPQDMSGQPDAAETGPPEAGGADPATEKGKKQDASDDATEAERQADEAKKKVEALEDEPPEKLEDWPDDDAKYETFGGPEGEHGYHEGPEQKLGPSSLRHHEGGEVEIEGEKVDDPDKFKADPIPGGPTDPNAPSATGEDTGEEKKDDDDES